MFSTAQENAMDGTDVAIITPPCHRDVTVRGHAIVRRMEKTDRLREWRKSGRHRQRRRIGISSHHFGREQQCLSLLRARRQAHIVYRTTGPEGDGLRSLNLEAHSINVLTKGCDNFPVWSPRGDLILFIRKIGDDFEVLRSGPTARMSGG